MGGGGARNAVNRTETSFTSPTKFSESTASGSDWCISSTTRV